MGLCCTERQSSPNSPAGWTIYNGL